MNVGLQGSKKFDDYSVFMRAMGVALSDMNVGDVVNVYTVGPHKVNSFLSGFTNLTEESMRARGMKIRYHKVSYRWLQDNLDLLDYFVYLSRPKEGLSNLATKAENKDVQLGVFRY